MKSSEVLHLLKTLSFFTLIVEIASYPYILLLKWNETPFITSGNKQTMQEANSSFWESIPFAFFWKYDTHTACKSMHRCFKVIGYINKIWSRNEWKQMEIMLLFLLYQWCDKLSSSDLQKTILSHREGCWWARPTSHKELIESLWWSTSLSESSFILSCSPREQANW